MIAWTSLQLGQAFAGGFCVGAGFVGLVLWWKTRNTDTKASE